MAEYETGRSFWRTGLLGFLFFFFFIFASGAYSRAVYMRSLTLKCEDEYVFSLTNTTFSMNIVNVPPSDVSIYVNSIPNNVELVSIKKDTYIPPSGSSDTGYGTHVEIVVRFSTTGDIKLYNADLQTSDGFFRIPFETVHVYANTQVLEPELSVSVDCPKTNAFPVKVTVGTHIRYTVKIKYAALVESVSYDIPENSLFNEIARYPIAMPGSPKADFTPNFINVVSYDWQPMSAGTFDLPAIKVIASSYSGARSKITFTAPKIIVEKAPDGALSNSVNVFESKGTKSLKLRAAFQSPVKEMSASGSKGKTEVSEQDIAILVRMYEDERASIPFVTTAYDIRAAQETRMGLTVADRMPSKPLFYILISLILVLIAVMVILLHVRNFPGGAITLIALILVFVMTVIYGIRLSRRFAVFKGGEVFPIPEKSVSKGVALTAASLVRIVKKAGNWYYIAENDTNGWIPSDTVILIR